MKVLAARRFADLEDIAFLIRYMGLSTVDEVEHLCLCVFAEEASTDRSRFVVADLLA